MNDSTIDRSDVATTDDDMDAEPARAVGTAVAAAITEWIKRHTELVRCTFVPLDGPGDEPDTFGIEILDRRGNVWAITGELYASLVELFDTSERRAAGDAVLREAQGREDRHGDLVAAAAEAAEIAAAPKPAPEPDHDDDGDDDTDTEMEDEQ